MSKYCKGCKYKKWRRRFSQDQRIQRLIIDLSEDRDQRVRLGLKLAAEFCKLGKTNIDSGCSMYIRKWSFL